VHAAVVELDALSDAVRAAAEDDDLLRRSGVRLVRLFEGAIHVRRVRLELGGTGIDSFVRGDQAVLETALTHHLLVDAVDGGDIRVAETGTLHRAQQVRGHLAELAEPRHFPQLVDVAELLQEPAVDLRQLVQRLDAPAAAQSAEERPHAAIVGHDQPFAQRGFILVLIARILWT
jgi:hypothetical protein